MRSTDPKGLRTLKLIDRMVKEGKMPALTHDAALQGFTAGKIGLYFFTTGALRQIINGVGSKFELRTTTAMPIINADEGPSADRRQRANAS